MKIIKKSDIIEFYTGCLIKEILKMPSKILIEVCCGSVDDAVEAAKGRADRIELNSSLFLGGLTP